MNQGKIVVRYSKAFFILSIEKNKLEKAFQDMTTVSTLLKEVPTVKLFLESPVVSISKKIEIVEKIFSTLIDTITLSFLKLIVENKRESFLIDISRFFIQLYRKNKGILEVTFTTATVADKAIKDRIIEIVTSAYRNNEIILNEMTDSSLIGGYVLSIDDQQYDASVSNQLKKIKQQLEQTSIK